MFPSDTGQTDAVFYDHIIDESGHIIPAPSRAADVLPLDCFTRKKEGTGLPGAGPSKPTKTYR